MTAVYKSMATAFASLVLTGGLVACGGSGGEVAAGRHSPPSSASPSTSPRKEPPPEWISLTPGDASEAKNALEGMPGVSRTLYDKGPQRFFIYYNADVTQAERQQVKKAIYKVLGY